MKTEVSITDNKILICSPDLNKNFYIEKCNGKFRIKSNDNSYSGKNDFNEVEQAIKHVKNVILDLQIFNNLNINTNNLKIK